MYSRIAFAPLGSCTVSRCTLSSAPSKTCAPSTRVSSKCRSDEPLLRSGRGSSAIEPILADQKIAVEPGFVAVRRGLPVVAPFDDRRQRQENRFGAASGLQAEQRAAIPDQIEFHVAAAAIRLEVALPLAIGRVLAPNENRLVRREEMIADRLREPQATIETAVRQVIEKNAADAARLAAMLQEKVIVAPALVLGIQLAPERRERVAARVMKMHGVFREAVIRRQIHAAAEPPDWIGSLLSSRKAAHI